MILTAEDIVKIASKAAFDSFMPLTYLQVTATGLPA